MQFEIAKSLIWNSYFQGIMTEAERDQGLNILERKQMKSIVPTPRDIPEQVLRIPKWQLN